VSEQPALFDLPARSIEPVASSAEARALAAALPAALHMGAMTWSYPGWHRVVYNRPHSEKELAAYGLTAYAKQPLLRVAEIDRSYYEPLPAAVFAEYAAQVPDDFRFVVKAHEDCSVERYPQHARYGKKRGMPNRRYLDPEYATRAVVEPLAGLSAKLHSVLFQFSPVLPAPDEPAQREFAERLHTFLRALPRGLTYAVELRTEALLTREYAAALVDSGAIHCHSAWTFMPSVLEQARALPPETRKPLLVRWLLRRGERYEQASARFEPFSRIQAEDPSTREEVATLVSKALSHGVPVCALVDNKAEGCAPQSIELLARALHERAQAQQSSGR
jgi:uncharacterized protein YecE (DUF72 family)